MRCLRKNSYVLYAIGILAATSLTWVVVHQKSNALPTPAPILFISKTWSFDYHRMMLFGIQQKAQEYNVKVEFFAPEVESDYVSQIHAIENVLNNPNKKYSGIIIAPNHGSALGESLKRIGTHGYKYVVVDARIETTTDSDTGYCGYIGTDNYQGGQLAAEYLAHEVPKGNIVVIRGISTNQTGLDREAGFMDKIREYPALKIVKRVSGDWNSEIAHRNFNQFMKNNTIPIDAIFAYSDPMALSVAQYFEGKPFRPIIVGYNGDREAQAALLKGHIDATVTQAPELMGRWAVDLLFRCIERNGKTDLKTPVSLMKVTKTISTQKHPY